MRARAGLKAVLAVVITVSALSGAALRLRAALF